MPHEDEKARSEKETISKTIQIAETVDRYWLLRKFNINILIFNYKKISTLYI